MKIGNADWRVDVIEDDRRRYWIQVVASVPGHEERCGREGPFRRLDRAEARARERLAETRQNLEDPPGPNIVATIRELDE